MGEPGWGRASGLLQDAMAIVERGRERGLVLRLAGALAVEHRCPTAWRIASRLGRATEDVDLVGLGRQWAEIVSLFEEELGYTVDERHAMLHGKDRLIFFHRGGFRVDVFLDRLNMCHVLDLRSRLELDPVTLTLADLLLLKLQIVELTRKDLIDIVVLLREHAIGEDEGGINGRHIAERLRGDWGFYHTATRNLRHLRDEGLGTTPSLDGEDHRVVRAGVDDLLARIEANPKTLVWRARALIGTRMKWYNEVDELIR